MGMGGGGGVGGGTGRELKAGYSKHSDTNSSAMPSLGYPDRCN